MQVKSKVNALYKGKVYNCGAVFEMDDVSARVCANRGTVEILGGENILSDTSEIEDMEIAPEGLPPLEPKKKK